MDGKTDKGVDGSHVTRVPSSVSLVYSFSVTLCAESDALVWSHLVYHRRTYWLTDFFFLRDL